MSERPRLVLVGPPGAGKTMVGQVVAARLRVAFRDTDLDIEARAGKPVQDIFVQDGEDAFRALEREAVRAALGDADGVLALGGGAVLDEGTRALLADHHVVYLDVTLTAAAHRVGLDTPRPLLVANPRTALRRQLEERRPLYEQVATAIVQTADRTPEDIAEEVAATVPGTVSP
ncbi:MAG: shikimate kinase [Streptosporangiales bacterium]